MPPTDGHTPQVIGPSATGFFRAYSARFQDHLYTTSGTELFNAIATAGYQSQGFAGRIFTTSSSTTVPLIHLVKRAKVNNMYTTSSSEVTSLVQNGYIYMGIVGYVYGTPVAGSVPFYRLYHPGRDDHFYTVNIAERLDNVAADGYLDYGIVAYVLPPN
ncbi:hypothetical protein HGRIS_005639 [Hohenbuehelia grisea]|uniref:DUF5648 domain-containing protein n=1 Tax=Hohenbuehelia grisea TaxID=104357 RepID=A0ABR3JYE6_9AGAR